MEGGAQAECSFYALSGEHRASKEVRTNSNRMSLLPPSNALKSIILNTSKQLHAPPAEPKIDVTDTWT